VRSQDPDHPKPRYTCPSGKLLTRFHHACDARVDLLNALEFMAMRYAIRPTGKDRRVKESLVAAHKRLWPLRNPELLDC
jgi:hypothetical protein